MKKTIQGTMELAEFKELLKNTEKVNLKIEFSRLSVHVTNGRVKVHATYMQDRIPPLHLLEGTHFEGIFMNPPFVTWWTDGVRDYRILPTSAPNSQGVGSSSSIQHSPGKMDFKRAFFLLFLQLHSRAFKVFNTLRSKLLQPQQARTVTLTA